MLHKYPNIPSLTRFPHLPTSKVSHDPMPITGMRSPVAGIDLASIGPAAANAERVLADDVIASAAKAARKSRRLKRGSNNGISRLPAASCSPPGANPCQLMG